MIAAKLLSGLAARATFRRRVTARVRKLVRSRGQCGRSEMVIRPPNGLSGDHFSGRGGPDHRVLDATLRGQPVRLAANMRLVYKEEVAASVVVAGRLVYMRTHGGGVELIEDPTSWFWVIDEMERKR